MHFNKYYHSRSQTAEPLMWSFNFCFMAVSTSKIQILKNKIEALFALKTCRKQSSRLNTQQWFSLQCAKEINLYCSLANTLERQGFGVGFFWFVLRMETILEEVEITSR